MDWGNKYEGIFYPDACLTRLACTRSEYYKHEEYYFGLSQTDWAKLDPKEHYSNVKLLLTRMHERAHFHQIANSDYGAFLFSVTQSWIWCIEVPFFIAQHEAFTEKNDHRVFDQKGLAVALSRAVHDIGKEEVSTANLEANLATSLWFPDAVTTLTAPGNDDPI